MASTVGFVKEIDQVDGRFEVQLTLKTNSLSVLTRLLQQMGALDSYAGAIDAQMAWSYKTTRHPDVPVKGRDDDQS